MHLAEDVEDGEIIVPSFSNEGISIADGRFTFKDSEEDFIGLGGFGVVFRGKDERDGKEVAIKRVLKQHIKYSEIDVIRSLQSSFLIGLIDVCHLDDDHSCIVMELCDTDLDYHIRKNAKSRKLTRANLRLLVDNLARGYKALNDLRIVHRDIKPQNILVQYATPCSYQFSAAKITDFGICRSLENGEMSNVAGSLFYMAPEVGANLLKTCQYDAEVDMWSIGCLIYQCVVGELPFDEGSLCKLFLHSACANYDAYDQPDLPEGTDESMASLIRSLLEIEASKRATPQDFYKSATNMTEIL
ncbi:hypothetical protein PENTCL1PPCAC_30062 [Pristionchus entomophagus]|uniref:Protein kinase domain-containing protein n=1 Tax=Pristionchus entomophagus TaxID=358040 RepID=A0AAV5UNH5_9BILA|nr:hypothetical protein PENTCL1PPCAC_30062 [Pristionchus entomophagus]